MNSTAANTTPVQPQLVFATTRWTLVLRAGAESEPEARRALEDLCRLYWYPLYAYVRRQGHSKEDAEDITQGFFASFLKRNYLENVSAEKGRFRAFLLGAMKHYLANDYDRRMRQKRGGGAAILSLDWSTAETRYQQEPPDLLTPDKVYDRTWAIALLETVLARLKAEYEAEGKPETFEHLRQFLMVDRERVPYAELARELHAAEGAVRVMVHRLRRRYRELLRAEIAQTLASPEQAEEELRALMQAF